ncbi:copper resistance CopC/CopD family protein [Nocardia sp. NPDC004582]
MTATRWPRAARRSATALLVALGTVSAALILTAAPASAHAVLVGSDPGYGAMVEPAPDRVSITFDEAVTAAPNAVTVTDRDGERADTGATESTAGGRTIVLPLRPGVRNGTYLLGWSLLSADGHVVAGSTVFGIGVPPDLTVTATPPDPLIAVLDTVVRLLTALGYLGIALAVGLPLAARMVWPDAVRTSAVAQVIRIGAATTAIAALLTFATTPGRLAGAAGWAEGRVWSQSATSFAGTVLLVRAVGAIALVRAARQSPPPASPVGVVRTTRNGLVRSRIGVSVPWADVAGGVVLSATALSGHVMAGEYRWAAVISAVLHLVAMAVWVGGVLLVGLAWRTSRRNEVVGRFGPVAAGAVAVLAVSGVFQSWRAVSPLAALWSTSWGLLLSAKLVLVAVAVGAAVVARGIGGRARAGAGRRPVATRSASDASWVVRAELAAQVAVLVVTALLTGVAPARETYDPPASFQARVGSLTAAISVDGTHAGRQEITVRLRDAAGTPVGALEVSGRLERADGGIGPVEVPFRRVEPVELGPEYFVSRPVRVPLAGEWRLRLTVVADRTSGYAATVPYRVW